MKVFSTPYGYTARRGGFVHGLVTLTCIVLTVLFASMAMYYKQTAHRAVADRTKAVEELEITSSTLAAKLAETPVRVYVTPVPTATPVPEQTATPVSAGIDPATGLPQVAEAAPVSVQPAKTEEVGGFSLANPTPDVATELEDHAAKETKTVKAAEPKREEPKVETKTVHAEVDDVVTPKSKVQAESTPKPQPKTTASSSAGSYKSSSASSAKSSTSGSGKSTGSSSSKTSTGGAKKVVKSAYDL